MTKNSLLTKTMAQKIAKTTGALLMLQWAYDNTIGKHWNVTDPEECRNRFQLCYWIMIVVNDDEPRSSIELMNAARTACKGHNDLSVTIFRKREALRKLKNNHGDFAMVYRLGYALYNTDKKTFPQPGYARNGKQSPPAKPLRSSEY